VVLLMPPWEDIYRTDAERDQTFAESVQVCEDLRQWYAGRDYETIEVPRTAIDQRVNFILQTVEYALTRRCGRLPPASATLPLPAAAERRR